MIVTHAASPNFHREPVQPDHPREAGFPFPFERVNSPRQLLSAKPGLRRPGNVPIASVTECAKSGSSTAATVRLESELGMRSGGQQRGQME
jgi:hypothetical protein